MRRVTALGKKVVVITESTGFVVSHFVFTADRNIMISLLLLREGKR